MISPEKQGGRLSECLRFDPEAARREIVDFIRAQVEHFARAGVVVGISGGLDSSTVALLCTEALGKERVLGLILPERDTAPENTADAVRLAETVGIPHRVIDVSPILASLGTYELFPGELTSSREAMEGLLGQARRMTGKDTVFFESYGSIYLPGGPSGKMDYVNKLHAFMTAKTRTRMMVLFFHAILADSLVVGTDDRTETTIGFYDKYGDGACDISVLGHLYKTQIRRLAGHIGVPEYILNKRSSHDLWGRNLPNEEIIGLSYAQLDTILCGLKAGMRGSDIAREAGTTPEAIEAVKLSMRSEMVRRGLPLSVRKARDTCKEAGSDF
jgi:NAD+ synthase